MERSCKRPGTVKYCNEYCSSQTQDALERIVENVHASKAKDQL
jgi:hypothetical protein